MYDSKYIADRIRSRAKECGITQKAMLADAGLGGNSMSHLDNGKSIAVDSLGKIADVLKCSVDYLLGRSANPAIIQVAPDLSEDEQELLSYFRQLDSRGRRHVLTCAEDEANALAEKGTTETIA